MKKFKSIIKAFSVLTLLALVSCSDIDIQKNKDGTVNGNNGSNNGTVNVAENEGFSYVKISAGFSGRTVEPGISLSDLTDFVLTGSWVNGSERTENETVYTWQNYEAFQKDNYIPIKNGMWTFKLSAKKGNSVYSGVTDETEVRLYWQDAIHFTLKRTYEPEDGTGTMNLTLGWSGAYAECKQPSKVVVTIKKDNAAQDPVSEETVTNITNPLVITKELNRGTYRLNAAFYTNDGEREIELINWPEIVTIASDHTSSAEQYVYFDEVREINWNLCDGTWKEGAVIPLKYSQKKGVTLPDTSSIEREGYFFYGWNLGVSGEHTDKIEPGRRDNPTVYAEWGRLNPKPESNGIVVDMILPENTYEVLLFRSEKESGERSCIWSYNGDSNSPLDTTLLSVTDYFTEEGKTYTYDITLSYVDGSPTTNQYYTNSDPDKWVTAVNETRIPKVTYIPDGITADIMNDTLVLDETQIEYEYFDDMEGFTKKARIWYETEEYSMEPIEFKDKSFKSFIESCGWQNKIVKPSYISLIYVSDDKTKTYGLPEDESFNSKFPSFRVSATKDHTIIAIEPKPEGFEFTVNVPAGTKQVKFYEYYDSSDYFCTIGDGKTSLSDTDTTVKVLNSYRLPSTGNSTHYWLRYIDSDSEEVYGDSSAWIITPEGTERKTVELNSVPDASFDENKNCLILNEKPELSSESDNPQNWGIEFEYNYEGYYTIKAEYSGGAAITTPLLFTPDADAVHKEFNSDNGEYTFYRRTPKLKVYEGQNVIFYFVQSAESIPYSLTMHKKYTVTFDSDGAGSIASQSVNRNAYASVPSPEPQKEGFIFGGWFLTGSDTPYNFEETPVTDNITLKAKWLVDEPPAYSVSVTVVKNEMPMEYTIDEETGKIDFKFERFAGIYLDGECINSEEWYDWSFNYRELPKGFYVLEFIQPNDAGIIPGNVWEAYSFTLHIEVE